LLLAALAIVLGAELLVLQPAVTPTAAGNPVNYAWAYYPGSGSINATGAQAIIRVLVQDSGHIYVGEATGICYNEYGACAGRVIETGIARGSLTNDNYRQYLKYVDANGSNVLWSDSTNLSYPPGNYWYGVRVQYDGSGRWEIYRASCDGARWENCQTLTKIHDVSADSVGFSAGQSVYGGAAGDSTQTPPGVLTLNANLSDMQYRTSSSGYTYWSLDTSRIAKNSCFYRVFAIYPPDITVDMFGSCP
jgi:hypothetical protein